ncbi:MAG: hypothetical protein U1F41_06815 [Burkholderiales bacterium]
MFAKSLARLRTAVTAAALAALSAAAVADVGLNKSFSPNSVVAGQVTTVVIDLLNPNASVATGVALTDNLPANLVIANPLTIPTNTCGFTVAGTPGTSSIAFSNGTIPALAAGVPGSCRVTVNVVSSVPSTYLNSIPAGAVASSQGSNVQSAQATLVVSTPANITAGKVFSPTVVHGNGGTQTSVSTLTITLTNPNVVPLTSAAITDSLPASITIATPSNAATTCGAGTATASSPAASPATISLSGGTIPAGGSCTITVQVIARNPNAAQNGAVTNTVAAGALTTAEGATSPQFTANITVQTGGALTKAFSPAGPIAVGGTSTLTITVSNFNQTTLSPITFTDTLPAGLVLNGVPTTTCSGTLSSVAGPPSSVTLTGASLGPAPAAAGATTCTVTVPVIATTTGTKTNNIAGGTWGGVAYTGTGNVAINVSNVTGSKSFSPATVLQGGTTALTITLTNGTNAAVTINAANGVTDNLGTMGTGFSVPAGATVGGTCGSSLTSPLPTSTLVFAGGTIPALGSCTITISPVNVAANASTGARTDTIAANGVQTSGGNNVTTITGPLTVTQVLTAAKTFLTTPVIPGARSTLRVRLTRAANASALSNIAFTDNLTTMAGLGFTVANPSNASTTCTGGTVTATPGGTSFSLAGGSLAGGAAATTCDVFVDVQVPPAQTAGTFTNTLAAGAVTSAEGFTNAAATAGLQVVNATTVTINKAFSPTTVAVGGTSTMTLQIRNNNAGAITLTGVGLVDTLPPGMVVANPPAPTTSGCSVAPTITAVNGAGTVTLANATVNANTICTVNVNVRANNAGNLINTLNPGAVTSNQGVTNPLLGSATLASTGAINLSVTKTTNVTPLVPGGATSYTVGIANSGPNAVSGLVVNDNPPPGITFTSWTCTASGGATCTASGSGPIADTVSIPNGGAVSYAINAAIDVTAPGPVNNQVCVVVPGTVINTGNTCANVSNPLAPTLGKSIAPPTIALGGAATLTIGVGNNNSAPISLTAALTDTMPAGVTTTTANTGTCGGVTVTSTSITMASGSAVPAGGCTIVVGITSSTPGTVTNVTGTLSTTVGNAPPASAPLTVTALAPTLGKGIAPSTIPVGGTATLTLTLGNPNGAPITLASPFTDPMPSGVTTTSGNGGTCAGVSVAPTLISLPAGASIPVGGCTIVVSVTSVTPGSVINTTSTLSTNTGTAPAAQAPLTVTIAPPSLGKSIAPPTIAIGGTATLTLTLGNPNAIAIALTSALTDTMPAGVTISGANSGTCGGVTTTATTVTVASGTTLNPGSCTIVVPITSSTPGTVTNTTGTLSTSSGSAPPASAPLTVTATAPTLGKTIAPATIAVGGSATLTITVGNPNGAPITLSAALTDTMPAGVTITGANGGTCAGVTNTATTVTMASGTTVNPGGCTIVVPITSSTPGTVTNTTGTLNTNAGSAPPASAPLTVNAPPTLAKSIAPSSIAIGGTATLTLTLGNPNPGAITLTAPFSDPMPSGVTISGANMGTCAGVTTTATTITVASGTTLNPGSCTIVVPITSSTPGTVTNTTGPLDTSAGTAPPASAPLTLTAIAPTLGKTIAPATIAVGGTATLTITVGNPNGAPITLSAALTDTMPAGVTITGANTGTCAGVTNTATTVTMASGTTVNPGSCTIVVPITSSTPGSVTNTTGTLTTNAGSAPPASAPLDISAPPTLAKTIAPSSIAIGGTATLTLTLGNPNPGAITLTTPFTDTMPAGVTISGANTGTCAGVSTTATAITVATGTTLNPGSCTIVVPVTSSTPGTVTNITGPLDTSSGTAPPAQAPLTVTAVAPTLAKAIAPATIVSGGTATLTITIGNGNTVPITLGAAFTDTMPAGVTIAGANTGTCAGVTNTPTVITMASGTGIPVGGCTIVVTITSTTPGTVTNTTGTLTTNAGNAPPASAPLTVTAANATLAKSIVPGTIGIGGSATLTLTLGNPNATPLTLQSAFVDTMPTGVTITGANGGTCTGVTNTTTAVTMASGSQVPPGGCTIVLAITSSTPGSVTNTTGPLVTEGGTAPPASAPLVVTASAASLAKTIAPATIPSGGTATLTITIGNTNGAAITLTAPFTDTMPAGVTIAGSNTGTCTGVTNTPTVVTMASGTDIPIGGCTIVVTITSTTVGTVTNTTGTLTTNAGTTPPASAPLTVTASNVGLAKTIAPATIPQGGTATLTLTLSNTSGAAIALTAPFTDTMPAGVTITGANTGTCAGVTNTATAVTMASGSTVPAAGCTIVVPITSSTVGTVTNTTGTLSTSGGSAPPASAPLTVLALPTLAKTIAPATIAAGGTATLTLVLGNTNAAPILLTAPFTDVMPAGVTTVGGNAGTCSAVTVTSTTVTKASGSTIPVGGCTIVVTITSSTTGTVTNTTGTLATEAGNAPPASAPLAVTGGGGVASLAKSIAPGLVEPGGTATLTITIGNAGSGPLVLTAPFTDPMPPGMTVTSSNTGTCAGVTTTSTLITMATGTSVPPGGCTIVVTVTSSTPGTVTNVTSPLVAGSVTAPAASAPLAVTVAPVQVPANSPVALLLAMLAIASMGAARLCRSRPR